MSQVISAAFWDHMASLEWFWREEKRGEMREERERCERKEKDVRGKKKM
jgi:hypothetical protein